MTLGAWHECVNGVQVTCSFFSKLKLGYSWTDSFGRNIHK